MNYKLKLAFLFLLLAAMLCGCEWLKATQEVAATAEGRAAVSGLVSNVISGNWLGAVYNLVEFLGLGYGVHKATMIRRDGLRKKRGEEVAVEA
jgi:hypothetical protein